MHPAYPQLAALIPPTARRVLDVGCGAGDTGALIKARLPECRVVGLELDAVRATEARGRLDEVVSDATQGFPFEPASFDAIIVTDALAHLADPRTLLRDLSVFLAVDGLLVAVAPAAAPPAAQTLDAARRALCGSLAVPTPDPRRYSRGELASLMLRCGYEPTSLRLVRDPGAVWVPLPLDGARLSINLGQVVLRDLSADEVEAMSARELLVTALRFTPAPPECSIIIVADDVARIRDCVEGVRRHLPRARLEIIAVVGDAGGATAVPEIADVRLLRNREHLSRAASVNQAARHARGEYLVVLDGEARPEPGWLDALLEVARARPDVGAVGSKRVHPDGRVAQAGVALGGREVPLQALPYPLYRGADARAPHVSRARPVSAAAGSGFLVSRRAFVDVGGLDEGYCGWYADADLCLALRSRGLRIRYCPESRLEEPERPHGKDPPEDIAYFLHKWAGRLVPDDGIVCRADGTDLAQAYGLTPAPGAEGAPTPVVWTGHFLERAGFGEEARSFVLALHRAGLTVQANPITRGPLAVELPETQAEQLGELMGLTTPDRFIHVVHLGPTVRQRLAAPPYEIPIVRFERHPRAVRHIGRTMFETDRIPEDWVDPCNDLDEVWVPSTFNVETFARSGVEREKLHVVPGLLPLDPFDPWLPPLPLPGASGFVFLSVFGWGWRKGWDAMVQAYLEEFGAEEPVSLVFHVNPSFGLTIDDHRRELEAFIRTLGRHPGAGPRLAVSDASLSITDMVRLYRAADAFVLASRGEAWGRPYMEAMAAGVPVIGTRWSGQLDFMRDDNAYLIDCTVVDVPERLWREVPYYRGHRCAEPSVAHLRSLMRHVFEERAEAATKAARAQEEVLERFRWASVAAIVTARLGRRPAPRVRGPVEEPAPVTVAWQGQQFSSASLATVNRELCRELLRSDDVDLVLMSDAPGHGVTRDARLAARVGRRAPRPIDVHVRHEWPPAFVPPPEGRWVMIQPWEYESVPRSWIEPINRLVDELWVPSHHVRAGFVRSGVDPRRVVVVPNGVDAARFHPGTPPRPLPTRKAFRFLFVGGTLLRKGMDILLETYLRAFRPEHDVCLVVKDQGAQSFYRGQGLGERIRALAADPRHPEIVYLDEELPEEAMPGLYTACHCLVHPYRGEGFGLPILEAMACGLPVIVPAYGPALEFCDPGTTYRLPATEVRLSEARVGDLETVDPPAVCEVDRLALALAMRRVVERPEEARERGRQASERARRDFTWSRSAEAVRERLRGLATRPVRRRMPVSAAVRRRTLSACLVVRDEEDCLPACLTSVRDVADDIVVVDTGSTDRTAEVARAHGARVVRLPWADDWAAARNAGLAQATGDWILVLDADEALDPGSHGELRRLLRHDRRAGFVVRVLSDTDAPETVAAVEHRALRLFPNHPALRFVGRIHEQVVSLRTEPRLELVPCGVILHHHGYRSAEQRRRKAARNLPLLERLAAEAPEEPFHAYNLGLTHQALDRLPEAEAALRRAIALGGQRDTPGETPAYLVSARVALALALATQGRDAEAAACCRDALGLAPELADAWCALGAAELRLGHPGAAWEAYQRALGCGPGAPAGLTDRDASGWKAWAGMGEAALRSGRWETALLCLERASGLHPRAPAVLGLLETALGEALRHRPDDPGAHRLRAELLAARGDLDGALAVLRRALELDITDPETLAATGQLLRALGAVDEAQQAERAAATLRATRRGPRGEAEPLRRREP